jgi:protein-S-isoprenylcysteine O-methyltransferase Ste14
MLRLASAGLLVVAGGVVFVLAHRLEWTLGWIYVGLMAATLVVNLGCLLRWNPELIGRRVGWRAGTKPWDMVLMIVLFAPATIAIFVVSVLDVRDGVWDEPGVAWLLGLAVFVSGWALATWSMVVNPFFEKTVRIQTDHGHRVIDTGPYAYIRHPGYVGFIGWLLSTPLLLGSAWAFVPALLSAAALVIRTALEDHTLRDELPGYSEYTARVCFRLIPGVW